MAQDELAQMSRDELIELILTVYQQNVALQETVAQLRADNEALRLKLEKRKKPPTNSSNSSQPPARDYKRNLPSDRRKRKHGPPVGHPKHERKFVANPDHIVSVKAETCSHCDTDLCSVGGVMRDVNQITELPPAKAEVIEVRQYEVICPECGKTQVGKPPPGLEMERAFGARLEATVVYYRQEQHMSYQRTQAALLNLHGVEISQGGIDQIMRRAGQHASEKMGALREEIRQSAVVHCDETSSRVDGQSWWEWVFCTTQAVLHLIRFNRSSDVILDVMGERQAEVWISDCLLAQLRSPAKQHQICLAHQIRNLQAAIDHCPAQFWARAMQALFRYVIHLHHQRDQLPADQFQAQVARVERLCDWLIQRSGLQPDAGRLQRRYIKYRDYLFVCLHRTDVSPTNNVSERALRPSVIHRKVISCFRSGWGARTYAALASVIDTAELSGINPFDAIQSLSASPALPLPLTGE
jgi:transposase